MARTATIVGYEDVVAELRELLLGRGNRGGILLIGSAGVGKTYMTQCLLRESPIDSLQISMSTLIHQLLPEGVLSRKVIVFLDEIDGIARKDSEGSAMCSLWSNPEARVVAATSYPERIPPVLLAKFPHRIFVPLPNRQSRKALLRQTLNCTLSDAEVDTVADRTDGYSIADLITVSREVDMKPLREAMAAGYIFLVKHENAYRFYPTGSETHGAIPLSSDLSQYDIASPPPTLVLPSQTDYLTAISTIRPSVSQSEEERLRTFL